MKIAIIGVGAMGSVYAGLLAEAGNFAITLNTRLNGEIEQGTSAAEMIFSIPELIAYISHTIELRPGDIISTGSPEDSGGSRQPPRFFRAGDTLNIEVSGVGALQNRVG